LPVTHWGPFIFFKMYGIWQEKLVLGQLRLWQRNISSVWTHKWYVWSNCMR
jgi:hypothetical protein